MNKIEIFTLLLGLFIVLINVLSFGIGYSHALQNGLKWDLTCNDDVTVSESLLLLSNDAGFSTSMSVISACFGALLLYIQFSNREYIKYVISFLYLFGLICFSILPFVVINTIPEGSIAPLPNVPIIKVTQVYNPYGHMTLAFFYGFCMSLCIIISTWVYTTDGRNLNNRIVLYIVVAILGVLLINFLGSMIDMKVAGKNCLEQNKSNKWFSGTEFGFLILVNIWIIIIASPAWSRKI
jgi:hypothetical protein